MMENPAAPFVIWLEHYHITPEALALVLSTLIASVFAWLTIKHSQHVAKLRLTFDTIHSTLWDKDYLETRQQFIKLRDEGDGLARFANTDAKSAEERGHIRKILNDYENLCIGMKRGIIDEQFVYFWQRKTFIDDFDKSKTLITFIREKNQFPTAYEVFEEFTECWRKEQSAIKKGKKMDKNHKHTSFRTAKA